MMAMVYVFNEYLPITQHTKKISVQFIVQALKLSEHSIKQHGIV